MGSTSTAVSRRALIAAAGVSPVLALAVPAAAAPCADTKAAAALIDRDRLGTAITRSPQGLPVALAYTPDFHERLSDWLRFWWANAPASWTAPFEVQAAGTTPDGQALLLTGITYTSADRRRSGFDARNRDARYWATVAGLYQHFSTVTPAASHVRVSDGQPGFTGSPTQVAFVREALTHVWQDPAADWEKAAGRAIRWSGGSGTVTGRSGWTTFTRATLRRGLGTDS